ncbi:MAG: VCBS repeat-containing protein [Planctomycetes bacterium]|nr:VCBS repeat-containing protein [Planctomycetota bacterium]
MRGSAAGSGAALALALGATLAGLAAGCTSRPPPGGAPREPRLTDVTEEAGIRFRHESGARGEMLNPETFGPGAGWLDFDGDGRLDLLLVNGNVLRGAPDPSACSALYRNLGGGKFADVTREAGLAVHTYGMGFVSGDVENDGDQDVLIYGLHRSVFFANEGGRFRDATERSGLAALTGWVGCAAFLDYDLDGRLDLFAGNYVNWSPEREAEADCTFGTPAKKYCPVAIFRPSVPQLFRGRGDGTFEETTDPAGFKLFDAKALGVAVEDFDRDGRPDILVANDTVPNLLLRNRGDGTFEDRGVESGFATGSDGAPFAGMGIDTAWLPDGRLAVAVGNFSGEPTTLHVQEGERWFVERSFRAGVGRATVDRVTFGCELLDLDLDGSLDLALANGHVFDVEDILRVPYRQRAQVFFGRDWNRVDGLFEEARSSDPAHFLNRPILGRALTHADHDGDGDLDLVVTENQGRAVLLRNDLAEPRSYVRLELRGTRSNRDAIGAEVTLHVARPSGRASFRRTRKAVSSYLSQPERQVVFGLGASDARCDAEVLWPLGLREVFRDVPRRREVLLVEGTGERLEAALPLPEPAAAGGVSQGGPSAPATDLETRQRGLAHLAARRFEQAAADLGAAARLDPQDIAARRALVLALARAGRRTEAEAQAREAARVFPDPHLLVAQFALVLRQEGLPELAALFFEEAARLDPRRLDAWIGLGNIAFDAKAYPLALERYERALAIEPRSLEALANAGKALTIAKDYGRAKGYLEKAVSLRPDYAAALSPLGGILIEEGDLARAEEVLGRALAAARTRETLLSVHGNLGILHLRRRDRARALECFQKVLELDPEDPRAREAVERLRR